MANILAFAYSAYLNGSGLDQNEIAKALVSPGLLSPYRIANVLLGLSISIFSGYFCAKKSGAKSAIAVFILSVIIALCSIILGMKSYSIAANLVLCVLAIVAIYSGASIHWRSLEGKGANK